MIISLNWLNEFVDLNGVDLREIQEKIGARLVEVEETISLKEKFSRARIVKVISCEKIPETHLSRCLIDDGGVEENVPRENNLIQVVCGAPNVRAGIFAIWLPPNSVVPATFGKENFVLTAKKLRGFLSQGMLAAADELDLGDDHEGILELSGDDFAPGELFAKKFDFLSDVLLEIENKSLTHRPDAFGHIGFAREVATILGKDFKKPARFTNSEKLLARMIQEIPRANTEISPPKVEIIDPELCPRYECAILTDIKEENFALESDLNEQILLNNLGMRPVNFIVDSTNLAMLESAQPLHAFDYDKLRQISPTKAADIVVRAGIPGEKLELLDGRTIKLTDQDVIIAAGNRENSVPIALAGAMGGASTAIDKTTCNILLESATFNLYNLRGTQFRHGIFSEAITRFTKGQPAEIGRAVLISTVRRISQKTGAKLAGKIVDNYAKKQENPLIELDLDVFAAILGGEKTSFDEKTICDILRRLDYEISRGENNQIAVRAPFWRTDINIAEEVVEDVGRVFGYENLTPKFPSRDFGATKNDEMTAKKQQIREILRALGANEILTYSFVSENLLQKTAQEIDNSYKIINAISPDLQRIRTNLLPSLLEKVRENLRRGFSPFALFELNQVFRKGEIFEDGTPRPRQHSAFVFAEKLAKNSGSPFFVAKKYLLGIFQKMRISDAQFLRIDQLSDQEKSQISGVKIYEAKRAAIVKIDSEIIGAIGEISHQVKTELKIKEHVAGFEIDIAKIRMKKVDYRPLVKYQGTTRDLTFQVKNAVEFAEIENLVRGILADLPANFVTEIKPLDIFAPAENLKNITLRIEFADREKTIQSEKVAEIVAKISKKASEKLDAKII